MKKLLIFVSLALILSFTLTSCTPTPTEAPAPEAAEETQPTEVPPTEAEEVDPTAEEAIEPTEAPSTEEITTAEPKGTIRIALTTDIAGIWPSNAPEWQSAIAAAAFHEGGGDWVDPETGKTEKGLILSCEASEDYKTFTFHLRPDVVFSNGEPYTADAYVYSYALFSDTSKVKIAWPWPGPDLVTVKKIDDLTVEMVRSEPTPNWCNDAFTDVVPPQYVESVGIDAFLAKPVGVGPFVVDEWVRGSHVAGHANPLYWREGYPKAANIVFKFIPDVATRVAALKTGEVDIITRLSAEDITTLENDPNIKISEYALNRVYYVAFNNLTTGIGTPIEKIEVRMVLNHAVDKQAIIDTFFSGKGRVPTGLIVPGDIGYDPDLGLEPIPYDVEKAKELLAAAGYPDGFEIGMACPDGYSAYSNDVCQAIQGYLEAVGITFTGGGVEFMDTGKFWDLEGKVGGSQLPPLFMDSWSSDGDPFGRVNGTMGETGSYRNWYDQRIQDLLDTIQSTGDMDVINNAYAEIQKIMLEDPFFIFLYQPYTFEATSVNVEGYAPLSNEYFDVWPISITE
ncbi:MAG: ABC transporter substrate-binding protein [Anaerolineales bacterium]|nr:ABC transporter substrate-binding protein [Anaerolineales bacterium]